MSKKSLQEVLESLLNNNNKGAGEALSVYLHGKTRSIMNEDHEKSMSSEELAHYLKTLHSKVKAEHKEKFASHLGVKECNDESFAACAAKLSKDKKKADNLIHKLEKLTDSAIDPKEYKKDKKKGESDSKAEKDSKKTNEGYDRWDDHFDNDREAGIEDDQEYQMMDHEYEDAVRVLRNVGDQSLVAIANAIGIRGEDEKPAILYNLLKSSLETGTLDWDTIRSVVGNDAIDRILGY
jgi:hypothetical protein